MWLPPSQQYKCKCSGSTVFDTTVLRILVLFFSPIKISDLSFIMGIVNTWWVQIETENANTYLAIINWSFELQTLCSITNSSSRIFPQLQKKFLTFCGTWMYILVQISPKHVIIMSQIIHSKPSYPTSLRQNVILFSYLYIYFPGGFPPGFL